MRSAGDSSHSCSTAVTTTSGGGAATTASSVLQALLKTLANTMATTAKRYRFVAWRDGMLMLRTIPSLER